MPTRSRSTPGASVSSPEPYNYSWELERALATFFGHSGRWSNSAGSFHDPRCVRDGLRAAIKIMQRRIDGMITADHRLVQLLTWDMEALSDSAASLGKKSGAELSAMAALLNCAGHLLGYYDGQIDRELVHHQTLEQQKRADERRNPPTGREDMMKPFDEQERLICELHDGGNRLHLISRIMTQPEARVRAILIRHGRTPILNRATAASSSPSGAAE